ncbi:MAG: polysaccharide deacetylase family protein [Bacteroidales bacterium]|nr:polysaccharide deacetylase family protein [Bacteroidales bacterium]
MKGFLNHSQIEYVLYHLGHHVLLHDQLKEKFVFLKSAEEISNLRGRIIFLLSKNSYNNSESLYINGIPILFPLSGEPKVYSNFNGNIIFNHDLIKSSFYLLSGYQERNNYQSDSLGRFAYESSIQAKLNIINKPIVNYYFDEIINGIREYCKLVNIEFTRKKFFNGFAFFLTHDIDRVKYYNLNTFLFTVKLLFGLSKSEKKKLFLLKELFKIGINIINVFNKKDPYWNFKYLSDEEKKLGVHSTFFFLPKDKRHVDAYYDINSKKIRSLMEFLLKEDHEIGLHGTVRSHFSYEALDIIHKEFLSISGQKRTGIRQHRLMWRHPETAINHDSVGIVYDSTLGFAAHEGFRNSYCHPFRLFDFENNRMLSLWEIPLNVMDATLFYYRELTYDLAERSISMMLNEIKRFNGVFTLLWHNSYFNENDIPGITRFYFKLLALIMAEGPEICSGMSIVDKCNINRLKD